MPVDEKPRDTQGDPFLVGEFVGHGEILLAVALHHVQVLQEELQLRGRTARRLGQRRYLAAPDGTLDGTDFEGAAGRDAPVEAQHPQGGSRLQPLQREHELQGRRGPGSIGHQQLQLPARQFHTHRPAGTPTPQMLQHTGIGRDDPIAVHKHQIRAQPVLHGGLGRMPPHLDILMLPGQELRTGDRHLAHRPARQHHLFVQPEPQAAPDRLGLLRLQGRDPVQRDHDGRDLVGPRVLAAQRLHHGVVLPGEVHGPVLIQPVDLFAQRRHPGAHIVHAAHEQRPLLPVHPRRLEQLVAGERRLHVRMRRQQIVQLRPVPHLHLDRQPVGQRHHELPLRCRQYARHHQHPLLRPAAHRPPERLPDRRAPPLVRRGRETVRVVLQLEDTHPGILGDLDVDAVVPAAPVDRLHARGRVVHTVHHRLDDPIEPRLPDALPLNRHNRPLPRITPWESDDPTRH
ncbi:hypothetical protein ACFW9L_16460 [Streptomyces sp. NPDC059517]|uniref:hypothetical protein n=1 Tax=Streptomyces sp. NPDC059517 TaxID=3346855 RepID=UPI0036C07A52